jgi:hypothetical protein
LDKSSSWLDLDPRKNGYAYVMSLLAVLSFTGVIPNPQFKSIKTLEDQIPDKLPLIICFAVLPASIPDEKGGILQLYRQPVRDHTKSGV